MKIIFLDVDGELTYSNYRNNKTADIDIKKVKLLKEICDNTGAKVVISSSWRGNNAHTPHIYYILLDILETNGIEVLGKTPYIMTETIEKTKKIFNLNDLDKMQIKYGTGRAAEIQKWLSEHKVDNFVILDDEDFNWSDYGYEKFWIQPTWFGDGGLKKEHVDKAIKILKGEI